MLIEDSGNRPIGPFQVFMKSVNSHFLSMIHDDIYQPLDDSSFVNMCFQLATILVESSMRTKGSLNLLL